MQIHNSLPADLAGLKDANVHTHGFLPIAAAYCRRLGLVELVNSMIATQMELKPGLVVQAMVLDVLSGRNPLYHVEHFLAQQDIQLLLGEAVDAHAFNDTNLARSLDAMFECGTAKIVTELGLRAASTFPWILVLPAMIRLPPMSGESIGCARKKSRLKGRSLPMAIAKTINPN
jgi:hypothetical protein